MYPLDFRIVIIKKGEIGEAMTSKIILMMPKNQELSKFQKNQASRIKSQRIKIQEQLSFKIQYSSTIKIKTQDSRFKIQEKFSQNHY